MNSTNSQRIKRLFNEKLFEQVVEYWKQECNSEMNNKNYNEACDYVIESLIEVGEYNLALDYLNRQINLLSNYENENILGYYYLLKLSIFLNIGKISEAFLLIKKHQLVNSDMNHRLVGIQKINEIVNLKFYEKKRKFIYAYIGLIIIGYIINTILEFNIEILIIKTILAAIGLLIIIGMHFFPLESKIILARCNLL